MIIELLNKSEHLNCYLYGEGENMPVIEYVEKSKDEIYEYDGIHNRIVLLLKGRMTVSSRYQTNSVFEKGTLLLLPGRYNYVMRAEEDSTIIGVNVHHKVDFCSHFPLETLYENNKNLVRKYSKYIYPLQANERVWDYMNLLADSTVDGLLCLKFLNLKREELFFYLRAYYPQKELAAFFAPILNKDLLFAKTINEKSETARSIEDLAAATNYSISGFKKRFVKVFDMAPYTWLEREKAKRIYHVINCSQKTFKEISTEYGFLSPLSFNKFCKKNYGIPPSTLRKKSKQTALLSE
ncbi:MAG: helix-turn-helix domain-containing protein [Bacteroidales bacterium]|nr:helix-turn-helix domain-containing protein [Bacteroidales bacterium]